MLTVSRRNTWRALLCATMILGLLASGCQPAEKSQEVQEAKIAAIYPLTGPTGQGGQEMIESFKLALEIVNGKHDLNMPLAREEGLPNLGGAKLVLVTADHQGNAEIAYSETERLISQENPAAIIGAYQSSCAKTASRAAEREQVPFLNAESSSPTLHERGFDWYFRTGPHEGMFVPDTFDFLVDLNEQKSAGITTIALLNEDSEAGVETGKLERSLAAEHGFEIVADITFHSGTTDLTSEVLKLKDANPDVVMSTAYTQDVTLLINTMKEQKYIPKLIVGQRGGWSESATRDILGSDFDYMTTTDVWAPDLPGDLVKAVNDMFVKQTGKELTGATARGFTGMLVLAEAINRAGSTDHDAIRRALEKTDIPGDQLIVPWPGVKFDVETHQNVVARGLVLQVLNEGFATVWPFDRAAQEIVFPLPSWDAR